MAGIARPLHWSLAYGLAPPVPPGSHYHNRKICRDQILLVFYALVDSDKGVELLSRGRLQRAGSALLRRTWDLRSAPASASNVADDADA